MIQIITFSGRENYDKSKYVVSSLGAPQSLDEFELNLIDLSGAEVWRNSANNHEFCNSNCDLNSIRTMILNCNKTNVIIVFPQNISFGYLRTGGEYKHFCQLKNMIGDMVKILGNLYSGIEHVKVNYENTTTSLAREKISAAFYFSQSSGLLFSDRSRKNTAIKLSKVYLTTLELNTDSKIEAFLSAMGLLDSKEKVPEWFHSINAFDDVELKNVIQENEALIVAAKDNIAVSQNVLERNNRFKSILYTSGDELVEVIFDILQDMLGCDLSNFIDEKKEDFLFEIGDKVYIGEIKGVNHNVQSTNVSQLDVHVQDYLDNHPDKHQDDIVALLIMNHQKKYAPQDREVVHDTQVKLAERNGSLIVETVTLLDIYEAYKMGKLGRGDVIKLFGSTGILVYDI